VTAYLVDSAQAVDPAWLEGRRHIGITAGASAPEVLVQQVVERVKELGAVSVRTMPGLEENVAFPLPKGLSRKPDATPASTG
jgi:4-hydroxy-3-methylbut-2-en-1-yl diphosphate reductase